LRGDPETLLESELFGHVRGAFTDATTTKKGKFSLANRGSIFLDEIGTISAGLQAKLLRVLQEREIEPLGAERASPFLLSGQVSLTRSEPGATMKFAKIVFIGAGVWGIVVLTPLFFLFDVTGHQYAPPTSYPQFFYGFLGVAIAWQIAFLTIGSNPGRFRPLMIASVVEKFTFVVAVAILYGQSRIPTLEATAALPDLVLGVLFITAFASTASDRPTGSAKA
jgi:hypothetical protein